MRMTPFQREFLSPEFEPQEDSSQFDVCLGLSFQTLMCQRESLGFSALFDILSILVFLIIHRKAFFEATGCRFGFCHSESYKKFPKNHPEHSNSTYSNFSLKRDVPSCKKYRIQARWTKLLRVASSAFDSHQFLNSIFPKFFHSSTPISICFWDII